MGLEAPSHWIIIAVIVIALFGYKKMPDAARSIGRSLRIFKGEIKEMTEHETEPAAAAVPAPAVTPAMTESAIASVVVPEDTSEDVRPIASSSSS